MLKKILLVASVFLLQGCLQEPTDEGCISNLNELELSIQSPSKNTCFSKNKMIHELNVMDYRVDNGEEERAGASSSTVKWFEANKFIKEEEAKEKNARQEIHNENDLMIHEAVNEIYNTILDSRVLTAIIALLLLTFVMKGLTAGYKQPLQELKMYFIPLITIAMVVLFFISDNTLQKKISRALVYTADTATRIVEVALVKEMDFNKAILQKSGENEATGFLRNLYLMNVCISNNQKNAIQDLHIELNDFLFTSQTDISNYYFKKNQIFNSETKSLEGESSFLDFFKSPNGITSVSNVSFQDCGTIKFEEKHYDEELVDEMFKYNFGEKIKTAVLNKDPRSGWEGIKGSFIADNAVTADELNEPDRDKLLQLLVAYSYEYKKGLLVGVSDFSDSSGSFSGEVLTKHLEGADQFYNILNSSVCVENGLLIEKSKEDLENYGTTNKLTNFECLTANGSGFALSNENIFNEKKEKDKIEDAIEANEAMAVEFFNGKVAELAQDINEISDFFEEEINANYKPNKELIAYINEGMISFSKFLKALNTESNVYIPLYKEILNIVKFDIEEALQSNFTNRSEDDSTAANTSLYTVQKASAHLPEIKEEYSGYKSNASSQMLEKKYNVTDIETGNGESMLISDLVSGVNYVRENSMMMTCNGLSREECEKSLVQYSGVTMWQNILNATKDQSYHLIKTGIYTKVATVAFQSVIIYAEKRKAVAKKEIGKDKFSKSLTKNIIKFMSATADMAADFMIMAGTTLLTISAFMELLLEIPHFMNVYTVVMAIFMVQIMPLVLVGMGITAFHGNLNIKMHTETVSKMFGILITPFVTIISSVVMVLIGTYSYVILLDLFPLLSDWLFPGSGSTNEVTGFMDVVAFGIDKLMPSFVAIIPLFITIGIVFWVYIKILKVTTKALSKLMTESERIIGQEIETATEAVKHIQNATLLKEGWSRNRWRRVIRRKFEKGDHGNKGIFTESKLRYNKHLQGENLHLRERFADYRQERRAKKAQSDNNQNEE